jgi:hypothetical protein
MAVHPKFRKVPRKVHVPVLQYTYSSTAYLGTASSCNDGAGAVDCDSRRAVGPTKTIRGVVWTQLNRLERLAVLSALCEWSFYA